MLLRFLNPGLLVLLLCPASLFADALLLQRIQTRYQQTGSFTARFVQVDQRAEAEERRAQGSVRYKLALRSTLGKRDHPAH